MYHSIRLVYWFVAILTGLVSIYEKLIFYGSKSTVNSGLNVIKTKDVKNFIEKELLKKISRELSYEKFGIVSEADLQSVAYSYLKQYLNRDTRYKIYNKIYLARLDKQNGIYPDMVIFRTMVIPKIALEFKEHAALREKDVKNDLTKLYGLQKMDHGYLIYLTRQRNKTGDMLTGNAQCMVEKKYLKKVTPLVINAYDKIPESQRDNWEQKWEKYSKLRMKKN